MSGGPVYTQAPDASSDAAYRAESCLAPKSSPRGFGTGAMVPDGATHALSTGSLCDLFTLTTHVTHLVFDSQPFRPPPNGYIGRRGSGRNCARPLVSGTRVPFWARQLASSAHTLYRPLIPTLGPYGDNGHTCVRLPLPPQRLSPANGIRLYAEAQPVVSFERRVAQQPVALLRIGCEH